MTSLTRMIADTHSPVAHWMRKTFPNPKSLLAEIRAAAGTTRVMPPNGIAYTTQGGAIDWWLRFLTRPDEIPNLSVAREGAEALDGHPAYEAAWPLFTVPTGITVFESYTIELDDVPHPLQRLTDRDDEYQARVCYALSLLTECFRAGVRPGSRLLDIPKGSSPQALLDLASETEVADLIAMRDSAQQVFLPALPDGPVSSGPTFDGSRHLPADADMITDHTLIEFKATIGGPPRKDGTRTLKFDRADLYQLLAYLLMDYTDQYAIKTIGLYAIRFETYLRWPVDQFLSAASGTDLDLTEARKAFARVLVDEIPPYLSTMHEVDWAKVRGINAASRKAPKHR